MRRLLALALAVAMVAGALALRNRLDDDGGGGGGGGSGGGGGNSGEEAGLLICVTELAAACEAIDEATGIETRVEEAGVTADALVAGELDVDGWLTLSPWPEMVAEARQRAAQGPVLEDPQPAVLARSPLVLVGVSERVAALRDACGQDQPYWRCVGDHLGTVSPAHDPADRSATGLLVLGSAAVDFFGTAEISSGDFQGEEFLDWFTKLERSTTFTTNFGSLVSHVLVRPSTFNVVGAIEAPALAQGARKERYTIIYPAAMATADVVLTRGVGRSGGRVEDAVNRSGIEALTEAGWRVGDTALPPSNGLPRAGVLEALRRLWSEVAR